jgi:DNA-binding MarR family transcriptional regulator
MRTGKSAATAERPGSVRMTYLVKQLELAIRADMDVMAREYGLTALQYTALTVLKRHPGMSGAQLSRRSFVSAQAGSEMIATLERKNLITRNPDPSNRRILRISLTADGENAVDACEAWMDRLEKQMLSGLSVPEAQALRGVLDACVLALTPSD